MSALWYAVHTQVSAEAKAAWHLANQGYEVYLPRYRKERRHARRVEQVTAPLFPRYLFVRLDLEVEQWRSINGTVGVCYLLTNGERPLAVGEDVITAVQAREDDDGLVRLASTAFTKDQLVRVADGPLADVEGLFQEMSDGQRATLLLTLLGRSVRVTVPLAKIVAA